MNWDSVSLKHYKTVEEIKSKVRKSNMNYLCEHPEIRAILRLFIYEAINQNPKSIYEFAANLFHCKNTPLLTTMINAHLKRINEELKNNRWSKHDGEKLFTPSESSHSLLSKNSVSNASEGILQFAMFTPKPESHP